MIDGRRGESHANTPSFIHPINSQYYHFTNYLCLRKQIINKILKLTYTSAGTSHCFGFVSVYYGTGSRLVEQQKRPFGCIFKKYTC